VLVPRVAESIGAQFEKRTCKHLRKLRGDAAETARGGKRRAGEEKAATTAASETADARCAGAAGANLGRNAEPQGVVAVRKARRRACVLGRQQFLSRLGNVYHAPDWFLRGLPATALDGELFLDRKSFQRTIAIVRRQDKTDLWKQIRYLVFDAPAHGGKFEERLESLKALPALPLVAVHPHVRCAGKPHLQEELQRVETLAARG